MPQLPNRDRLLIVLTLLLGAVAWTVTLAIFRVVDGDLWARLAVGELWWKTGTVPRHDVFAFTPVLPEWIDHEWGAGVLFQSLYRTFGLPGLMGFKIIAGLAALAFGLIAARRLRVNWSDLLLLTIPCAFAVLPGFIPVVRSHTLTFVFYALTVLCLALMSEGKRWPALVIPLMMVVWVNVHGGFVTGLIALAIFALTARHRQMFLLTLFASLAATLLNPYGLRFWSYLIPAILHPRADITEWGTMSLWNSGPYAGYWILLLLTVIVIVVGWKGHRSTAGLILLALTALAAWRHRRHVPFFGLTTLVFLGPYLQVALRGRVRPAMAFGAHAACAVATVVWLLPRASLEPAIPPSFYPVKAVDILEQAGATGNLAVPFRWGSYASWRLYPRVKVSMDGRYEETYPDSTFEMNRDFFYRQGKDWDRLVRQHRVDFVILDLKTTGIVRDELTDRGFKLVWADDTSALLVSTSTPLRAW